MENNSREQCDPTFLPQWENLYVYLGIFHDLIAKKPIPGPSDLSFVDVVQSRALKATLQFSYINVKRRSRHNARGKTRADVEPITSQEAHTPLRGPSCHILLYYGTYATRVRVLLSFHQDCVVRWDAFPANPPWNHPPWLPEKYDRENSPHQSYHQLRKYLLDLPPDRARGRGVCQLKAEGSLRLDDGRSATEHILIHRESHP